MASVWRAYDRLSGKEVALKIPLPRAGARGRREVLEEALALCRLDHEGIVRLLAVESALTRFHLAEVRKRRIGNLSKGFQQRVSLAQAFLHDPPLVIVDEPTGGLDPVQRGYVQEVLRGLQGDRTVLLCTHNLDEARQLASNVAVLEAGKLVALGSTSEVLDGGDPLALFRPPGGKAA